MQKGTQRLDPTEELYFWRCTDPQHEDRNTQQRCRHCAAAKALRHFTTYPSLGFYLPDPGLARCQNHDNPIMSNISVCTHTAHICIYRYRVYRWASSEGKGLLRSQRTHGVKQLGRQRLRSEHNYACLENWTNKISREKSEQL